jgi:hypothetical protein
MASYLRGLSLGKLLGGNRAVGRTPDQKGQFARRQWRPVALFADQIDGVQRR